MSDFSGRGGGLFFRQGGTSFLSEGHPMGSSILMGEGGIQKNRRMGGGEGRCTHYGKPWPHLACCSGPGYTSHFAF